MDPSFLCGRRATADSGHTTSHGDRETSEEILFSVSLSLCGPCLGLGTWDLGLGTWDLGLGTWDLGLGTWDLVLGFLTNALAHCPDSQERSASTVSAVGRFHPARVRWRADPGWLRDR